MDRDQTMKRASEYNLPDSNYQELVASVNEMGYYKRTYLYFLTIFSIAMLGLLVSLYCLTLTDNLLLQILNGIVFGFFTVQLGLFAHDLSHGGVFNSNRKNRNLALLVFGLGCGLSEGRWFYKHNSHHQSPNHIGHDPDLEIPFVFSHEQAIGRSDFYKTWIFPYQHILFWFGLWFVYPYNILNSMQFLFAQVNLRSLVEIILITTHFVIVFGISLLFLPFSTALVFNLFVFLSIGIYMGLIFAPNHKGEDMLNEDQTPNWVHQITLTRNIFSNPLKSYFLGGLGHQIEHHLFPSMSRFHYPAAQVVVKNFCLKYKLPYHETTWLESMGQIHLSLKAEAEAWRN